MITGMMAPSKPEWWLSNSGQVAQPGLDYSLQFSIDELSESFRLEKKRRRIFPATIFDQNCYKEVN